MRFHALAADYDGTLAEEGVVDEPTMRALERFAATGRKLILVTGRELGQLKTVFPRLHLFDRVVAENGALLYTPATGAERLLATPPPARFVEDLRQRGVSPLSVGRCIVATLHPHEDAVLSAIREAGLELHVIFNKGSVMILPVTVSKATGLAAALEDLALSRHNVIAIGDAENDHALLQHAEFGVAVANALPTLKQSADMTTHFPRGAGVTEVIDEVIATNLERDAARLTRHRIEIGTAQSGEPVCVAPAGLRLLVAGAWPAASLLELAVAAEYQVCVITGTEARLSVLQGAIVLGGPDHPPSMTELTSALALPKTSVVIDIGAIAMAERAAFVAGVIAHAESVARTVGRPHFFIVENVDRLGAPDAFGFASHVLANVVLTTTRPAALSDATARHANALVVFGAHGAEAQALLAPWARAAGFEEAPPVTVADGEALLWSRHHAPMAFKPRRC